MAINIEQIEDKLNQLVKNISEETFIYELLRAYGASESTIGLLKRGKRNLSKRKNQIILKKKLFFQSTSREELRSVFEQLQKDEATFRHEPRFIIVTDYERLLAMDTQSKEKLDIEIRTLNENFKFFEPLAPGMGKEREKNENLADQNAALKMAKMYDQILKDNKFSTDEDRHHLNIFFSRILFCFFAEDTGLFKEKSVTNLISDYTKSDGSDLDSHLIKLFLVLNTEKHHRKNIPKYLKDFPFVNGELFENTDCVPKFSTQSRNMIIECGDIIWSEINLDIFGSIMQAVVSQDHRGRMGMHYTSLENINKVIKPLFLDDLWQTFENAKYSPDKLNLLLARLKNLRIFDPACGSGNFLVVAYKEISKLERKIIWQLRELNPNVSIPLSEIALSQFYGIEIDDFAHEVAILSLWLAKHQMNRLFKKEFGKARASLPLKEKGKVIYGNATRIKWEDVCPKDKTTEIYVLGNPPYLGARKQNIEQKTDMKQVFHDTENYNNLDYIACWFLKGAEYLKNSSAKLAFVSSNSICQGEQVAILWPSIFKRGVDIYFAHTSFKWENQAKDNAGITCVIIGLKSENIHEIKHIYRANDACEEVHSINAYLSSSSAAIVLRRRNTISDIPVMVYGNTAADGGHLFLNKIEKDEIIKVNPSSKKFIKKALGSDEFINDIQLWCLWIKDDDVKEAMENTLIKKRLNLVAKVRNESKRGITKEYAQKPHRFMEIRHQNADSIIVPLVSSERRKYIPMGFIGKDIVVRNACSIYNAQPWLFGLLTSQMHMTWVRAVAGRLKTDIRYSAVLCYNTFPVPNLSDSQKESIKTHAYAVIEQREKHPEKTMAELYDPDKMPDGLKEAHHHLDLVVERCYRSKPFTSDEERLEYLFKLYEDMITKEKARESAVNDSKFTKRKKRVASNEEVNAKEKSVSNAVNDQTLRKGRKRA